MAFPPEVLLDIVRGKEFYSDLNKEYLDDLAKGCGCGNPSNYTCLKRILRSLEYKVELDEFDDVAEGLHDKMIKIIGGFVDTETVNVYWGFKTNNDVLSYADIIIANRLSVNKGSDITVPYVTGDPLVFLWWAVSTDETVKNYFQDLGNTDNKGRIGAEDELYGVPTEVTGATNMNFYITNWLTKQNSPLLFTRITV